MELILRMTNTTDAEARTGGGGGIILEEQEEASKE
jgi:hypothetical protein